MVNICDIYTSIFEGFSALVVTGVKNIRNRNVKYNTAAEQAQLEMNLSSLKSEI